MSRPDLASAAYEALAGDPLAALDVLDRASSPTSEAAWLRGVAESACGNYGAALAVLDLVVGTGGTDAVARSAPAPSWQARCAATAASVMRQVGAHARARPLDQTADRIAGGDDVARFDAALGLAADAVGLGLVSSARESLASAAEILDDHASGGTQPHINGSATGRREAWVATHWPRQAVRLEWVRCEVGLLAGDPAGAAVHAARAEAGSRGVSPRHHAKSLLFLAVARSDEDLVRRAWEEAEGCRALPVVWPACLVLARLTEDRSVRGRARERGASVYRRLGRSLPPDLAGPWLAAPAADELGVGTGAD